MGLTSTGPYKPHTSHTGHALSEKGVIEVDILTVEQLLQLRHSPFSSCKMCNRPNGSKNVALCSVLGSLLVLL